MGGTSFEQFRSSLRNPVARRAIGIEMSDDETVRIAADDALARAYYENWLKRRPVKAPTKLPQGPRAFVDNAAVGHKPRSGFWGCLGCLGVLLVAVVGFQLTRAGEDPADRHDNQSVAEVACENAVRANLKAPSIPPQLIKKRATGTITFVSAGEPVVAVEGDSPLIDIDVREVRAPLDPSRRVVYRLVSSGFSAALASLIVSVVTFFFSTLTR